MRRPRLTDGEFWITQPARALEAAVDAELATLFREGRDRVGEHEVLARLQGRLAGLPPVARERAVACALEELICTRLVALERAGELSRQLGKCGSGWSRAGAKPEEPEAP